MLTQKDYEYRKIHGVVPQLDCINNDNCSSLIPKTPVVHSRIATMRNVLKHAKAGKVAGGIGNTLSAMIGMAVGQPGSFTKLIKGFGNVTTGLVDPARTQIDKSVMEHIIKAEIKVWDRYNFLFNFVPSEGNLGDKYLSDGSCDEFHCGNGYKIFENGDYFEGYWQDGEISWGIYLWANGERYFGSFENGFKCQSGLTIYPNESYYDGNFENNKQHGVGTMWYLNGIYHGQWNYGVKEGAGFCKYEDGTSFAGEWINDQPIE